MRVGLFILLFCFAMAACASLSEADGKAGEKKNTESAMRIGLLTMNLHVAAGVEAMPKVGLPKETIIANLDRAADLIAGLSPDIVFLQEVDFGSKRSGEIDQARYLAERLSMKDYGHVTFDSRHKAGRLPEVLRDCRYGIAILSKLPVVERKVIELPNPPENASWPVNEKRVALWLRTRLSDGRELWVGNTHLDYRSTETRARQMGKITESLPKANWVLGGDFNQPPDRPGIFKDIDEDLKKLHGWSSSAKKSSKVWDGMAEKADLSMCGSHTYPAPEPQVEIDRIIAGSGAATSQIKLIDSAGISDHHFVWAVLLFPASR